MIFPLEERYGVGLRSGDVGSSCEALRNQAPGGLDFSLCGMPRWNNESLITQLER